ncbi:MAG TPA: DapH/DapD/GlmU-related protein [Gemmatimonadaceae bacterium]|nr:DapH/DapD/GlmU-related protein [Gemmatimonadaceae bacterium]
MSSRTEQPLDYGTQVTPGAGACVNLGAVFLDPAPITIGSRCWLGGGAIVCPGVSIGEDTIVGAGSVVVRDLPARVIAAGNPARVVREL